MCVLILSNTKYLCFDFIENKMCFFLFYGTQDICVFILSKIKYVCFDFMEHKIFVFLFYRK